MLDVPKDEPSNYQNEYSFDRQELTVLPADKLFNRPIGWKVYENIGIAVVNTWKFLPWWKKMWHRRFWRELFK